VISPRFIEASSFTNGRARIDGGSNGVYFIDRAGHPISQPGSGGGQLANSRYGYIDGTGKVVIPAHFEAVGPFYNGLARVQVGKRWAYIDRLGRIIAQQP
jgi:hypothetical protein